MSNDSAVTVPLSAIVLTFNEEQNLEACLESLANWVGELYVIDSGSQDGTIAMAERYGAQIVTHPFETHAQQWTWALQNLPLNYDWVLGLDADQRITVELRQELAAIFLSGADTLRDINGFFIKRRQIWRRQWIKHGTYYPKYLLKLFRKNCVRMDARDLMDHHFYVNGATRNLQNDLIEENLKENDISFWIDKHNRYARLLAQEEFLKRQSQAQTPIAAKLTGNPDERVMWLKQRWYSLPLYLRPFLYFMYRYVLRLGFLDGKQGFLFHFLQAFWFRLLVDVNLDDLLHGDSVRKT